MRVVVADDSCSREGIVRLLQDADIEVVAQAENADQLIGLVQDCGPDVAVVDIKMPPTHTDEGLVAAQRIRDEHPDVAVLVLSQYVEPTYAMRLLDTHAERVGYLLKERVFTAPTLVEAVRRVHEGESVIDPTIVSSLLARQRRDDPLAVLSDEREVLGLVAEGLSNKAIAARLYVTERTVEAHVTQIFSQAAPRRTPGLPPPCPCRARLPPSLNDAPAQTPPAGPGRGNRQPGARPEQQAVDAPVLSRVHRQSPLALIANQLPMKGTARMPTMEASSTDRCPPSAGWTPR